MIVLLSQLVFVGSPLQIPLTTCLRNEFPHDPQPQISLCVGVFVVERQESFQQHARIAYAFVHGRGVRFSSAVNERLLRPLLVVAV
jgi:hypothetical protein